MHFITMWSFATVLGQRGAVGSACKDMQGELQGRQEWSHSLSVLPDPGWLSLRVSPGRAEMKGGVLGTTQREGNRTLGWKQGICRT